MSKKSNLLEIAQVFFKLGLIAFGGPAAHIAMMDDEIVRKRKWMTEQHFLDLIGATNFIPGPNSTEMTMHCGYERGGWRGLFIAGTCFIFPAVVITCIFAWLYVEYGHLPAVEPFIYGIKPAIIAVILMAAYKLGKKAVKTSRLAVLGILTLTACLLGANKMLALFGAGFIGLIFYLINEHRHGNKALGLMPFLLLPLMNALHISSLKILFSFLKVGAILYGSGYVLFAYLDSELVANGWLTRQELLDAVAVGQFTPGPVLSTATFIGYQMNGLTGAAAATIGIFLPSFLFVLLLNPLIPKMRESELISALLDAVNVAAVALIVAVCIELSIETLIEWQSSLIAVISLVAVFGIKKVSPIYIVAGGAVLGYILSLL